MFKLVIQDDEGKTTVVPLIRDEITIGRKEGNTIRLTERNVSRRHARILRNNGEVQIEDLGSYNGIRVNNARIAERVALRVSDQVQIGDYKLYLKAEGVEQVDDARTMPIERVDANGEPAPSSTTTPTVPLGVPTQAANAAPANGGLVAATLIGNPNRTMVAIADTDPAGRPVATAAAVAALTTPVGYGKLVVLSSNFAGKELELSRPQMIVGRTDENDLVINHRSISRNHAKVVRETDTGRYTISDLQSSNGVRVNGQDYSKVELRRGDVVDLGHVRLRFIEPGEDFLFSRDAVINDVPETGGNKKGLLVAIVLAIVVLGGVGVFFLMNKDDDGTKQGGGTPDNPIAIQDAGSSSDLGSNGSNDVAVVNVPDAQPTITPTDDAEARCQELRTALKWHELTVCAADIKDPAKKKEMFDLGNLEAKAEMQQLQVDDALKARNFKKAGATRDKIPESSRYRREVNDKIENALAKESDDLKAKVGTAIANKECNQANRLLREATTAGIPTEGIPTQCTPAVAVSNPVNTPKNPTNPPPDVVVKPPPAEPCDAAASKAKGDDYVANGMDTAALAQYDLSLRCKSDAQVMRLAYMSACKAKNPTRAKALWAKMSSAQNQQLKQICVRYGITLE